MVWEDVSKYQGQKNHINDATGCAGYRPPIGDGDGSGFGVCPINPIPM